MTAMAMAARMNWPAPLPARKRPKVTPLVVDHGEVEEAGDDGDLAAIGEIQPVEDPVFAGLVGAEDQRGHGEAEGDAAGGSWRARKRRQQFFFEKKEPKKLLSAGASLGERRVCASVRSRSFFGPFQKKRTASFFLAASFAPTLPVLKPQLCTAGRVARLADFGQDAPATGAFFAWGKSNHQRLAFRASSTAHLPVLSSIRENARHDE